MDRFPSIRIEHFESISGQVEEKQIPMPRVQENLSILNSGPDGVGVEQLLLGENSS
jgi:hypothetical protein